MNEANSGNQEESLVGFFHLVNSMVPDNQDIVWVSPDALVAKALELMDNHGYSQLPVMAGQTVLGVFSYRSFARRVAQIGRFDIEKLEVDDCVEELRYVRAMDEIDSLVDQLDHDGAVLVGEPERLLAVLTPVDLIAYLYSLTRPFILVQEIELALRGLVRLALGTSDLDAYIERVVAHKYKDRPSAMPKELIDLDLGELVQLVVHGDHYSSTFSKVFGGNRDSARGYLDPIPPLRNDVFHFRRAISAGDRQTLVNTRSWLLRKVKATQALGK